VIAASPLAWMELSDVSEKSIAALAPFVRRWKEERDRWYGGVIHPVANRPDGVSWTGFVSEAADGGGYALMFRELSDEDAFTLDLRPIFGRQAPSVEGVVGGRGEANGAGGLLTVRIPEKLDFVWAKLAALK
jgi:alpha-galactosidase